MRERAAELTRLLLSWPSVTGSQDERDFGPRLYEELRGWPGLDAVWMEDAGDGRQTVCALKRGTGSRAVILAGHYDVVEGEARAGQEGDWLWGRGALDMKSGVAAELAVLEAHEGEGSILLVACPDEEARSAGARAAARVFPRVAAEHGLEFVLGINADVVTGDAEYGRQVFCGAVGKLLLCALVRGVPAHAGDPLNGVSAHALAAEVVRAIEGRRGWLDDDTSLAPPVLLHAGDTKTAYDVTMPRDVLLVFNLLISDDRPVLDRFADRVGAALADGLADWPGRNAFAPPAVSVGDIPEADGDPVTLIRAAFAGAELTGPGAHVALGPVRYPPVPFTGGGLRLQEAAGDIRVGGSYPHPSDISFLADGVLPWINAGPWGLDFHQPTERVYTPYAFGELPELLRRLTRAAVRDHR